MLEIIPKKDVVEEHEINVRPVQSVAIGNSKNFSQLH